jgi:hypothetical protein
MAELKWAHKHGATVTILFKCLAMAIDILEGFKVHVHCLFLEGIPKLMMFLTTNY